MVRLQLEEEVDYLLAKNSKLEKENNDLIKENANFKRILKNTPSLELETGSVRSKGRRGSNRTIQNTNLEEKSSPKNMTVNTTSDISTVEYF